MSQLVNTKQFRTLPYPRRLAQPTHHHPHPTPYVKLPLYPPFNAVPESHNHYISQAQCYSRSTE